MLVLSYKNIILRPLLESDLAGWQDWYTRETEWTNWNAPWWKDAEGYCPKKYAEDGMQARLDELAYYESSVPDVYVRLQIMTDCGRHIGSVSRACDPNIYSLDSVKGDDDRLKLGIVIPPNDVRGKGYGKNALTLWMAYLFESLPVDVLYTQTWSGNLPMIALAEKVGFAEHMRREGIRKVRGEVYDAVGFSVTRNDFFELHGEIVF
ncbi:MAG: GNAT family N-acetyltransferase [Defluviitaleaceae bacterium]|nr:GNAT family N-acetyltransferase [Defluviitaleaceae bacterium]